MRPSALHNFNPNPNFSSSELKIDTLDFCFLFIFELGASTEQTDGRTEKTDKQHQ